MIHPSYVELMKVVHNNGSSGWLDYLQSMRGSGNP